MIWPFPKLEAEMLDDAAIVAATDEVMSFGGDVQCHLKSCLKRIGELEQRILDMPSAFPSGASPSDLKSWSEFALSLNNEQAETTVLDRYGQLRPEHF